MSDRLSREHLESDYLVTGYARAYEIYHQHKNSIIFGTLAVLLVIGGGIWFYLDRQAQEEEAQEMLSYAEQLFQRGQYEQALFGDDEGRTIGFAEIASEFSRTSAGNISRYYAAASEARLGNYEDALPYIERFNPPDGILGVGPIAFHAAILSNLGQHEQAAEIYLKAAEWDENDVTTPQNLLNAAEAAMEAGNDARAQEYVTRVIDRYGDTGFAADAKRMQGLLSARN